METVEWKWNTSDGLEMFSRAWIPLGRAKGVVCVLHGIGEHIGRFQADGEALAEAGYVQAGFDLRGNGKSGGRRGHTPSLDVYFDDIDLFLGEIARRYPEQPRFLYGSSMGAVLALAYTPLRQPAVAGVIAVGAGLKSSIEEQKLKAILARVLGKLIPTLTLKNGVDVQAISRDPRVAEVFINDPLVHFFVTTAWGRSMLQAIDLAFENAPRFPLPLLLMHGTEDTIAYPRSSQMFAELAPKDMVTLRMWDGFKHELRSDPEKAQVFSTMIQWLDSHLPEESSQA